MSDAELDALAMEAATWARMYRHQHAFSAKITAALVELRDARSELKRLKESESILSAPARIEVPGAATS